MNNFLISNQSTQTRLILAVTDSSDVRPWPEATKCRPRPWGLWPWSWDLGLDHIVVIVKLLRTVAYVKVVK